jgi:glycerol uptake facilitator-like aquaporin
LGVGFRRGVLNYLKSLHTQSPGQYAFAAGAFAKVVLTLMCMIVILAVADNAGKRDLPIGGAVPDGLVDSVLSKSAAAEPWPSSLLLGWRGGK